MSSYYNTGTWLGVIGKCVSLNVMFVVIETFFKYYKQL